MTTKPLDLVRFEHHGAWSELRNDRYTLLAECKRLRAEVLQLRSALEDARLYTILPSSGQQAHDQTVPDLMRRLLAVNNTLRRAALASPKVNP